MDKNNFNHRDFSDLNLPLGGKIKKYAKIKMCKAKSNCIKDSVYIDDGLTGPSGFPTNDSRYGGWKGELHYLQKSFSYVSELLRSGIFFGKDFSHE